LYGGKSQSVRTQTLALSRHLPNATLFSTDVEALSIHVDGISFVVYKNAQTDHKDYSQRSGRTTPVSSARVVLTLSSIKKQKSVSGHTSLAGVTQNMMGFKLKTII
jgi:superfamily II DNA/RNA helicase